MAAYPVVFLKKPRFRLPSLWKSQSNKLPLQNIAFAGTGQKTRNLWHKEKIQLMKPELQPLDAPAKFWQCVVH
jgi:hypothetical protein